MTITAAGQIASPDDYPVRTPAHRDRDYSACLPADLDAAISELDARVVQPGRSTSDGMLTGGQTRREQARDGDDTSLGRTEA